MASLSVVNAYICANVLLILAGTLLAAVRATSAVLPRPVSYRHQLTLGRAVAVAAMLLPWTGLLMQHGNILSQTAQIWSAPSMRGGAFAGSDAHRITVSFTPAATLISLDVASQLAGALFLAGLLFALSRVVADAISTIRIIANAQIIRRRGSLRLLASDFISVPFSFWLPAQYFIVAPASLLVRSADLKIAIRHEAQHHRQQDTKWLYLYQVLKALFFWNPAVHWLAMQLRDLQEFACDEALSKQHGLSVPAYCQCLLRVAEEAASQRPAYIHVGMIGRNASTHLKRRIQVMLMRPTSQLNRVTVAIVCAATLSLMTATAFAFTSTIHDRRVSLETAAQMAAIARRGSQFPIAVNEGVLRQLRLLLATPDGRAYLQASLRRMRNHETLISGELRRHGLPLELLAVPLVESGYRNLLPGDDPHHGAGLWMFIAPTAQRFSLIVDAKRDDRLDVTAETGAAIRLLGDLHQQFGDWRLALLAYNAGSVRVEKAVREVGSRDAWDLISKGYENDQDYLARVIAAILVLKNPGVLEGS